MHFTVITVLKTGGEYLTDHVWRLFDQVHHHSPEASFVCLSDDPGEVPGGVPLMHDWPGWWSKVELFRSGMCMGPMVYLDLDSTVVAPIDCLVRERFTMLSDFYRPMYPASGVMAWTGDAPREVYDQFDVSTINSWKGVGRHGDQGYIGHTVKQPIQRFGGEVCSYKVHCQNQPQRPPAAAVIAYHGRPKPWEVEQ